MDEQTKRQIIRVFQSSAPGHCTDTEQQILNWTKPSVWLVRDLPSGGRCGVVYSTKSNGRNRLYAVSPLDGDTQEAIDYAKSVLPGNCYAYDPGDCEYAEILKALPVEII